MFEALVSRWQEQCRLQGGFKTRLEAKDWCNANASYDDDVYIIVENGKVIDRGLIDYMWENDADHQARI